MQCYLIILVYLQWECCIFIIVMVSYVVIFCSVHNANILFVVVLSYDVQKILITKTKMCKWITKTTKQSSYMCCVHMLICKCLIIGVAVILIINNAGILIMYQIIMYNGIMLFFNFIQTHCIQL